MKGSARSRLIVELLLFEDLPVSLLRPRLMHSLHLILIQPVVNIFIIIVVANVHRFLVLLDAN